MVELELARAGRSPEALAKEFEPSGQKDVFIDSLQRNEMTWKVAAPLTRFRGL